MLELPAPLRSIARRQLHLLFQCCARLSDETNLVTYCDRLRRGIHILDGETVTGEAHAIRKDAQIALACDLFDLDAASAGHLTYDLTGLVAELPQLRQIVAVDADRYVRTDP